MLERLLARFGEAVSDAAQHDHVVRATVEREAVLDVCRWLRTHQEAQCDYLACLSGVDREEAIEVVYHAYSLRHHHMIVIKTSAPKDDCWLPSVTPVWKAANWHERETAEMFGVRFRGHPDPRYLLLPEGWRGHPLRKDYQASPDYTRPDELPPEVWENFRDSISDQY
ncbi:MAG: NADH-quinone oxidoreductase subunit C [Armatimonadota bacterium]